MASSVSFTPASSVDVIYQNTALTFAQLDNAIGPTSGGGYTYSTNPVAVPLFDVRQYSQLIFYLRLDSLTGGTTPTLLLKVYCYDDLTHPGNFKEMYWMATQTIAATGGGATILTGTQGAIPATNTGVANINSNPVTASYRPLFIQPMTVSSGTPTGITGGRLSIYGIR
jgi:hypothetical protein